MLSTSSMLRSTVALELSPDIMPMLRPVITSTHYDCPEINMPQFARPGVLMQPRPWNYTVSLPLNLSCFMQSHDESTPVEV